MVPHQGSALNLLGGLQRFADPLLISSCLQREKRPLPFYKLIWDTKMGESGSLQEVCLYLDKDNIYMAIGDLMIALFLKMFILLVLACI